MLTPLDAAPAAVAADTLRSIGRFLDEQRAHKPWLIATEHDWQVCWCDHSGGDGSLRTQVFRTSDLHLLQTGAYRMRGASAGTRPSDRGEIFRTLGQELDRRGIALQSLVEGERLRISGWAGGELLVLQYTVADLRQLSRQRRAQRGAPTLRALPPPAPASIAKPTAADEALRQAVRRRIGLTIDSDAEPAQAKSGGPAAPAAAWTRALSQLADRKSRLLRAIALVPILVGIGIAARAAWPLEQSDAPPAPAEVQTAGVFAVILAEADPSQTSPADGPAMPLSSAVLEVEGATPADEDGPVPSDQLISNDDANTGPKLEPRERTATVLTSGLRLREQPTTSAPIVQVFSVGTMLDVLPGMASTDDVLWSRVRTADGATGWVAASGIQ